MYFHLGGSIAKNSAKKTKKCLDNDRLCEAYDEEVVGTDKKGNADVRTVLRLHPALAPYKAAILPLSKKLSPKAEERRAFL